MAKKLEVDHHRPRGVPPLSAYAYQSSVSLLRALWENGLEVPNIETRSLGWERTLLFEQYTVDQRNTGNHPGLSHPHGDDRIAIGLMSMPDAGLELELAIAQD
jgi:hypothetical protein